VPPALKRDSGWSGDDLFSGRACSPWAAGSNGEQARPLNNARYTLPTTAINVHTVWRWCRTNAL